MPDTRARIDLKSKQWGYTEQINQKRFQIISDLLTSAESIKVVMQVRMIEKLGNAMTFINDKRGCFTLTVIDLKMLNWLHGVKVLIAHPLHILEQFIK